MKKQQRQKGKFKIIRIIMPLFDLIILNLASFMALWVRFEFDLQALSQEVFLENVLYFVPFYTIISLCIFAGMRLYNSLWEFANIDEIFKIICASLLAVLVQTILMYVFDVRYLYGVEGAESFIAIGMKVPRSYPPMNALLLMSVLVVSRLFYRSIAKKENRKGSTNKKRTMIIGAGQAGAMAVRDLNSSEHSRQ